jgi:hypothetical protein
MGEQALSSSMGDGLEEYRSSRTLSSDSGPISPSATLPGDGAGTETPGNLTVSYSPFGLPVESTSALVGLWDSAMARYRTTVSLNTAEQKLFEQPLAMGSCYEKVLSEWQSFVTVDKPGSIKAKMKDKVQQLVQNLSEKIVLMDVVIGYPTSAV